MIDVLINLNQALGLMAMKDKELKAFSGTMEKMEKLLGKEEPTVDDLRELVKTLQSITSRFQSILRKLDDVELVK